MIEKGNSLQLILLLTAKPVLFARNHRSVTLRPGSYGRSGSRSATCPMNACAGSMTISTCSAISRNSRTSHGTSGARGYAKQLYIVHLLLSKITLRKHSPIEYILLVLIIIYFAFSLWSSWTTRSPAWQICSARWTQTTTGWCHVTTSVMASSNPVSCANNYVMLRFYLRLIITWS